MAKKKKSPSVLPILLVLLLLASAFTITVCHFRFYSRPAPTSLTTSAISPIWKIYQNNTYGYTLKYPETWMDITDPKTADREFSIESPQGEKIHAVVFENGNSQTTISDYAKEYQLKNGGSILFTYVECDGPGCGYGKLELGVFKQVLSTLRFL